LATVYCGPIIVKFDERGQLSFSTSIKPIDNYSDRIETALEVDIGPS